VQFAGDELPVKDIVEVFEILAGESRIGAHSVWVGQCILLLKCGEEWLI